MRRDCVHHPRLQGFSVTKNDREYMQRSDLEHLIRASGDIAEDDEIIIIGSQSILGQFPNAPIGLLTSMEADIYPANKPELADKVDGAIGEGSSFHEQYGYYAQGVGPNTAKLPAGWQGRLISIKNDNTRGTTGRCLEIHDLLISKLVAARPKDHEFIEAAVKAQMVDRSKLLQRLTHTVLSDAQRNVARTKIAAFFGSE